MISVENNQFTYSNIDGIQGSFPHVDGPNKFGTPLSHVQTTHTGTYTGEREINLVSSDALHHTKYTRYNITGTITKNIKDGIQYYQILSYNTAYTSFFIPANPYSSVDNVNITLWKDSSMGRNYILDVNIKPVGGANNSAYTVNFVIDAYAY